MLEEGSHISQRICQCKVPSFISFYLEAKIGILTDEILAIFVQGICHTPHPTLKYYGKIDGLYHGYWAIDYLTLAFYLELESDKVNWEASTRSPFK